jgi:hypothetical protein
LPKFSLMDMVLISRTLYRQIFFGIDTTV